MTYNEYHAKIMYTNKICPFCSKGYDIRYIGEFGKYHYKCYNCGVFLTENDFYVGKHEKKIKKGTLE